MWTLFSRGHGNCLCTHSIFPFLSQIAPMISYFMYVKIDPHHESIHEIIELPLFEELWPQCKLMWNQIWNSLNVNNINPGNPNHQLPFYKKVERANEGLKIWHSHTTFSVICLFQDQIHCGVLGTNCTQRKGKSTIMWHSSTKSYPFWMQLENIAFWS